jgi:hypothetical protein
MENKSRGPTFGDFVTIRTVDAGHHTEYKITDPPLPTSSKCNVLRESLSVDCQNIPKEKGVVGNLCISL